MIAALREDAPQLYAAERARREVRLREADIDYLEAMDAVFDSLAGRSSPRALFDRSAFSRLTRRVDQLLSRDAPRYGAASLFETMAEAGAPLRGAEIAALWPALDRAAAAAARFDEVAAEWRDLAAAIRRYDALLAETQAALSAGRPEAAARAARDHAYGVLTLIGSEGL